MIVFTRPRKQIEIEQPQRLMRLLVEHGIEFYIALVACRPIDRANLDLENTFVDLEHAVEYAIERKVHAKRLGIDVIPLLLEKSGSVIPVPKLHVGAYRSGNARLCLLQFRDFCLILGL